MPIIDEVYRVRVLTLYLVSERQLSQSLARLGWGNNAEEAIECESCDLFRLRDESDVFVRTQSMTKPGSLSTLLRCSHRLLRSRLCPSDRG
jgi:hypothetical protein